MDIQAYLTAERGRQAWAAKMLGLSATFINQIARGDRPLPVEYHAQFEKLTDGLITRKQLRPNDWQKIWPELIHD